MHTIDGRFRGANSLGPGDVNGDGLVDYSVNYEFDQRYVVYLHPPTGSDPRAPWPRVDLVPSTLAPGRGVASESSALGDLDGDGNVDLVGAQSGDVAPGIVGYEPGIRIFWGPRRSDVEQAAAWSDAGRVDATRDAGHYHWVTTGDVDRDGDTDILAGGRVLFDKQIVTGLLWIEGPDDPALKRDLTRWQVHHIDSTSRSGHGFVRTDVDEDGDLDLADVNADFDTPDEEEEVVWYRNPGDGTAAQEEEWPKHRLLASPAFTVKPQLGIGDLDGDGLEDLVTQTPEDLFVFRKTSVDPVRFETIAVRKPPEARFTPRTVRVADISGDGKPDVIGMLSHEEANVPIDKASVFWMTFDGERPTADNWTTHAIAWGPGRTMRVPTLGSKWDQADVTDVDGDGDLDIVANNEEWWVVPGFELRPFDQPGPQPESVSVVWFENRLGTDESGSSCSAGGRSCVFEAEEPTVIGDGTWVERATEAGSQGRYLQVLNGLDVAEECRRAQGDCPRRDSTGAIAHGSTRGVTYRADLPAGSYRIWLRVRVPSTFGNGLGGARSDSLWLAVDDDPRVVGDDGVPEDQWVWVAAGGPVELDGGQHELNLRVRERGIMVDRLVVSTDTRSPPSGAGPSLRQAGEHAP